MSLMLFTGIVMFIVLTGSLLKKSFPPGILFIILPALAALGLKLMVGTATLVVCSAMFFTLMKEAGVFEVIVRFILRVVAPSTFPILLAAMLPGIVLV